MSNTITKNVALEIISHEAIVREAYLDSKNIWTWGIGITNASGHKVHPRYKDNSQPLEKCIEIFEWVLRTKYAPAVDAAFEGTTLSESQFAAALSFHYNTGRIKSATWVKNFNAGKNELAFKNIMNWKSPPEIIPRREKERDLFFKGEWSNDGTSTEYSVSKPSYKPDWSSAQHVDITDALNDLFN